MSGIVWVGKEDNGWEIVSGTVNVYTTSSWHRPEFSRCTLAYLDGNTQSKRLPQALSTFWFTVHVFADGVNGFIAGASPFNLRNYDNSTGMILGISSSTGKRLAVKKYDGSTVTTLVENLSWELPAGALHKIDWYVTGYGTVATTTRVWVNGVLRIDASGLDTSDTNSTELDRVLIQGAGALVSRRIQVSEVIVATKDTRLMALKTLAPTSAGSVNTFTSGTFADIDEVTLSDADFINSDTAGQDFQANLAALPAGTWKVESFSLSERAQQDGGGVTSIRRGVESGGSTHLEAAEAVGASFAPGETIWNVNPVTGLPWTPSEIDNLQMYYQSAA